jgi:hypothetical protein
LRNDRIFTSYDFIKIWEEANVAYLRQCPITDEGWKKITIV